MPRAWPGGKAATPTMRLSATCWRTSSPTRPQRRARPTCTGSAAVRGGQMSFWHDFLARHRRETAIPTTDEPPDALRFPLPVGPIARIFMPPEHVSLPSLFTPPPASPPVKLRPLTDRDRYRLMLRYNLTAAQVSRLPLDIAHVLLALPR